MLKAGVSITDISPQKGVRLAGYPHCIRANKGVHDPLYASCLYLNNGREEVIFVGLDLLYIGKKQAKELRERIGKPIMFNASHTHSGPRVVTSIPNPDGEAGDENGEYAYELTEKLYKLITDAMAQPFEAKAGTAIGRCGAERGVGGNRRDKHGVCDPSVNVLAVKDTDDKVRACLVNYTLHPTLLHAENELVTADYPGYIRRFLKFAYPEAVMLFAQGAAGNQSSRYHRVAQDFDEAARVGTTIGVEAADCVKKMAFASDLEIGVKSVETDLPLRIYPTIEQALQGVEKAKADLEIAKTKDYITKWNAELALFGQENTLKGARIAKTGFRSEQLPCEIQIITLGDTAIIGIQGEMFVEYALEIKSMNIADKTFVFTVTNGALPGYICTPEAIAKGGYETGSTMLTGDAGKTIINAIKEIL